MCKSSKVNLTWVGFKYLLVEMFTMEYQKLWEGMNLGQMRHTWSLETYVRDLKAFVIPSQLQIMT